MYYKMTKKRPCKKYSLAKFRTLERFFRLKYSKNTENRITADTHYLAQSRSMFVVIVYLEGSLFLADRVLSVPQIDLSARADRKIVIFLSICVISQRKHDFTEQIAD